MAVLIDLVVALAVLAGLVVAIIRIRRSRVTGPGTGHPPPGHWVADRWVPGGSMPRPQAVAWAFGLALAVVLGLNISTFGYANPQGLTTMVWVAGTWKAEGSGPAATIRFSPDGTFTAAGLPDPLSGVQRPLPGGQRGHWVIYHKGSTWFVYGAVAEVIPNTEIRFTMKLRLTMDLPVPVTGEYLIYDLTSGRSTTVAFTKQL
jgi:hypothetical protein